MTGTSTWTEEQLALLCRLWTETSLPLDEVAHHVGHSISACSYKLYKRQWHRPKALKGAASQAAALSRWQEVAPLVDPFAALPADYFGRPRKPTTPWRPIRYARPATEAGMGASSICYDGGMPW